MRRKVLARSVRGVIERLESRQLLSATLSLNAGTGGILGVAYNDVNSNGVMDAGEPVLPGATITLQQVGVTYAPGTVPTVQADANGTFGFSNLATGQYDINIVPDPGFVQDALGTVLVTVSANDIPTINVGETNTGTGGSGFGDITGTLFNDPNQSGVFTPGVDDFLAGDTVYLDYNGNGVLDPGEQTTITNNLGVYSFQTPVVDDFGNITGYVNSVPAGSYEVRVVPRPGFKQDFPGYEQVTVNSDQQTTQNLGENSIATISGVVFDDLNGNGIQDPGEPGISGETVFLDENFDGIFEMMPTIDPITFQTIPAEPFVTSGANGLFSFANLPPGNYRVIVNSNAFPTPNVENTPRYSDVTVAAGQTVTLNIGEGIPSTISGTVFNDKNANGIADPGENGLANQTVYLDENNDGVFDAINGKGPDGLAPAYPELSAVTDANGDYTIPQVGPGSYTLRVVTPPGAILTGPANATHSYAITVLPGQTLVNENFGFETPDLTVKVVKFPTSPALTNVPRRITVRVTNVGSLPFNNQLGVNLWAQTTNAPVDTSTAFLIGAMSGVPAHLGIGQSRLYKFAFAYPTQLPLNAYFVSAQVVAAISDNNASNDFSAPIGPVQVGPPFIDIGLAYAALPPFTVDPGQPVTIMLLATNHGNVPTDGDLDFRIYLSQDPAIEPNAVVVQDTVAPHVRLAPGASRLVRITIPYPGSNINFKFINAIVSTDDPLGDGNQTNNTAIEAQPTRFD